MKNLKKVAALVIVLAMALSSVAFAAYTDVAEDASYSEAVEVMSALGLLKGYEDGTFGPDKTITRAEFAAVIVRALGMEDAAAGAVANTIFSDVTSAHWGAGYVQIANQQGIIAGYGNGTFGPDDEVTYEQAVKMIVCALGYGIKFAGVENAYPSAYLSQANTSGITVGATGKIGEKATRAVVARLVYNALDVKLMEQTGFGTDTKFEEVEKTLLSSKLNVAKVEASVATLYFEPEKADEVAIDVEKVSDVYCKAMDVAKDDDGYKVNDLDGDYLYAEGVNLQKGYSCVAYIDISSDESDWTILAIVPKAGKNSTLVLEAANTKEGEVTYLYAEDDDEEIVGLSQLTYFKNNADVDTNSTKIKLESDVKIFKNKNADPYVDYETFGEGWEAGAYNEITLIDNDNNNKYDFIYVTEYSSFVITEIVEKKYRIKGDGVPAITLDPEDEEDTYTIADAEGNAIDFADIKVGDVANVFKSVGNDGDLTEIIITNDTVEGTVTEWNSATSKYTIGDKEYLGEAGEYNVSDSGVFTIDMYGKIIDFKLDGSNRKFGMLYQIYEDNSGVDDAAIALILTAEGEFVSFPFSKKTDVNGTDYTKDEALDLVDDAEPKLVVYTVNSANELTKLYDDVAELDEDYTATSKVEDAKFDATAEDLGAVVVTDSSIILTCEDDDYATTDRANKYSVTSKAYFVDEEEYTYRAIVDENDEVIIAVIFGAEAQVEKTSVAMYVTSVGDAVDSEGDDAKRVKGYVDGELVTIIVPDDCDVADDDDVDDITVGSMIQYSGEDEAIAVKVLVSAADIIAVDEYVKNGEAKKGYYTIAGKVNKYVKNKIYFEGGDTATFDSGFAAMVVKLDGEEIDKVYANNIYAGDVETTEMMDGESDDYIIVYKYDGDEIGAIIVDVNGDTEL